MVYGGAFVSLHEATMIKWGFPAWMKHEASSSRSSGMRKAKGMALLGFPFTGLKVVVGRPDYRIHSRTIKRGFRLGNLITSSYGAQSFAYFAYPYSCCFLVFLYLRFLSLLLALQQAQVHRKRNPYASSIAFSCLEVLPVWFFIDRPNLLYWCSYSMFGLWCFYA